MSRDISPESPADVSTGNFEIVTSHLAKHFNRIRAKGGRAAENALHGTEKVPNLRINFNLIIAVIRLNG
jgi:hypothetical protein